MRTLFEIAAFLGLAGLPVVYGGCGFGYNDNPQRCDGLPDNDCRNRDAAIDSPTGCASNADCTAPTAVCDLADSRTCVQCTPDQATACTGTTPTCGASQTCVACAAHTDCPDSSACLPDGACAAITDVAYVAPAGTANAMCTPALPCSFAAALATARPYVKVATGLIKATTVTIIDGQVVTVLADSGATLDRDGDGPVLEVRSAAADVRLYDVKITGASGAAGADGIQLIPNGGNPRLTLTRVEITGNQGGGIAASGGTLTVAQSTVTGNAGGGIAASGGTLTVAQSTVTGNAGGGIAVNGGEFDITNSFIVQNGSGAAVMGGVKLDGITGTGIFRFEFNTVTANVGPATLNTGVSCGTVLTPVALRNNIIYANVVSGGGKQLGGSANCTAAYSDIGPDATPGPGNLNADPKFVNPAQGNFHLMPTSPAKDAADPAATLTADFDGEARPQGLAPDIGADEVP